MMPLISKLQETMIIVGILALLAYFFVVKPHYDLVDAKAEIQAKNEKITAIKYDSKKEVFETKYTAIKSTIIPREKHHEDINISVGFHTIIFD